MRPAEHHGDALPMILLLYSALKIQLLVECVMADREKITDGPNERAVSESVAGTAPGIPDEALTPGRDLPDPPSDEEVAEMARKLGANVPEAKD
jgi:hypothetical protein